MADKELIERAIESAKCRVYRVRANVGASLAHQVKVDNQVEVQQVTIEALEKQIPKKPIEQSTDEKTHYKCQCGYILKTVYKDKVMGCWGHIPAFCERCGQALDRSEEKREG